MLHYLIKRTQNSSYTFPILFVLLRVWAPALVHDYTSFIFGLWLYTLRILFVLLEKFLEFPTAPLLFQMYSCALILFSKFCAFCTTHFQGKSSAENLYIIASFSQTKLETNKTQWNELMMDTMTMTKRSPTYLHTVEMYTMLEQRKSDKNVEK